MWSHSMICQLSTVQKPNLSGSWNPTEVTCFVKLLRVSNQMWETATSCWARVLQARKTFPELRSFEAGRRNNPIQIYKLVNSMFCNYFEWFGKKKKIYKFNNFFANLTKLHIRYRCKSTSSNQKMGHPTNVGNDISQEFKFTIFQLDSFWGIPLWINTKINFV